MGKLCQMHILLFNREETLEPTFVFACYFLILSPVSVMFALYYLEKL